MTVDLDEQTTWPGREPEVGRLLGAKFTAVSALDQPSIEAWAARRLEPAMRWTRGRGAAGVRLVRAFLDEARRLTDEPLALSLLDDFETGFTRTSRLPLHPEES